MGVAQLVEPRIVIPVVAGSSPVIHPNSYYSFNINCLATGTMKMYELCRKYLALKHSLTLSLRKGH